MRVSNCVRCKQAFAVVKGPVCPACLEKEEEQFEKVKEFLEDNAGATMEEISEGTEVPVKRIAKFVKDGRLEGVKGTNFKCSKCGIKIDKGSYCQECAKKLQENLATLKKGGELKGEFQERAKVSLMKAKDRHQN